MLYKAEICRPYQFVRDKNNQLLLLICGKSQTRDNYQLDGRTEENPTRGLDREGKGVWCLPYISGQSNVYKMLLGQAISDGKKIPPSQ